MNITFDKEVDALYIRLQSTKRIKKTVQLRDGVLVDFDKSGKIFGIEILDVSRRMPLKDLMEIKTNLPLHTAE